MSSLPRKRFQIDVLENERNDCIDFAPTNLDEIFNRVDTAILRIFDDETENLKEERYFTGQILQRDPSEGSAIVRYNPTKGHVVEEIDMWDGLPHRTDNSCARRFDWETGVLNREISMIKGEYQPIGRGSYICYDVQTNVAVEEHYLYGPPFGNYSIGGLGKVMRDRLSGKVVSALQFDGEGFVCCPTLISTYGLDK